MKGLAPLIRAVAHSQVTTCGRLWIQYVFPHTCGVYQFCIIVLFTFAKPANNLLFCIKLIKRPESSLRRHKLGLVKQSVCSEEDKTRFTCVHRSMTTGQSMWAELSGENSRSPLTWVFAPPAPPLKVTPDRSAQFRSPLTYNFIPLRWNRSTLAHI